MDYNTVDTREYNRNLYLQIFQRINNKDDFPPYASWPQDTQYYGRHMDTFMADMRELATTERTLFDQILIRIQDKRRGPSEIKEMLTEFSLTLNQEPKIASIGGKRSSRKGERKLKRKSRNNKKF